MPTMLIFVKFQFRRGVYVQLTVWRSYKVKRVKRLAMQQARIRGLLLDEVALSSLRGRPRTWCSRSSLYFYIKIWCVWCRSWNCYSSIRSTSPTPNGLKS